MVICFGLYAQNNDLGYSQTYVIYNGTTADRTTSTDSVLEYSVHKLTDTRIYPTINLKLDSISGTASNVTVLLQKKQYATDSYSNVDTVTWAGSTSDTVIKFTVDVSREEFWKWTATGSDNAFIFEIDYTNFKFQK